MRVLIVEDDMAIAGSVGPVVTEAGHELVGLAADRDTAVALLSSATVHLALVDLRLADGWTGVDVVRAAVENDAAAVIMTANPRLPPANLAGADGLVQKPYTSDDLKAVLAHFAAQLAGRDAGPAPACLKPPIPVAAQGLTPGTTESPLGAG